jgi:tyrosyl-tRNA synthetase
MLKVCNVPLDKLKFVRGTEYQLDQKYTLDMYKMAASVTTEHTLKVCKLLKYCEIFLFDCRFDLMNRA